MIDSKYFEYVDDVLSGKIVACENIRLACERYKSFFDREDIEFRTDRADRVIKFIESLKHYAGKSAHKPFKLEPWQKWCVYSIFGFYWKGTNERVTKKVLLLMARKQGKSAFAAAIALYLLVADGVDGTQVLNVANNAKQAYVLFDMESNLLKSLDSRGKYFRYLRDRIKFDKKKSYSMVLASDASGLDGYGGHFICDETHEYKDSRLWDVLKSGQGYIESPIAMNISTAGFNINGFLYNYRRTCVDILRNLKEDDSQFSAIYELDPDDDWHDESVWIKSNPNLGVTVPKSYIVEEVKNATNNTALEYSVRTKNLNQWVQSKNVWIPDRYIDENMAKVSWEDMYGETCYGGADFSATSDLTAWTLMFPPNEDRKVFPDKYVFKTMLYVPESTYDENVNGEMYRDWANNEFCKCLSGNTIDYDYILSDQLKIINGNDLALQRLAYDKWNARQWAIDATNEGLMIEPYSQTLGSFNIPTKTFEMLLKQGKIVIDYNNAVKTCFANCELKFDHVDNCKPVKAGNDRDRKIDAVISMLQALGIYMLDPNIDQDVLFLSNA